MRATSRPRTSAASSQDRKRRYASRAGRTADHQPWGKDPAWKARRTSSRDVWSPAPRIRRVSVARARA
eukprot:9479723-Alexandrium_andersonii.AAC.1